MEKGRRYEYRVLRLYVFRGDVYEISPHQAIQRADGSSTRSFLQIYDSAVGTFKYPDDSVEERGTFYDRAERLMMERLNSLGSQGWRVVTLGISDRKSVV